MKSKRDDIITASLELTEHLENRIKKIQQQRDTIIFFGAVFLLLYLI